MLLEWIIVIGAILGLWFGGNWIITAAAQIARRFNMSELVIGLTIVAIGTSAPEFAVTISAALGGQSDISVGNVVGSNIFNLGFILGGVAMVRAIPTTRTMVFREGGMLIGVTLMLLFFLRDFQLQTYEGIILILGLISYVGYLLIKRDDSIVETDDHEEIEPFSWWNVPQLVVGIFILIVSGHYLVDAASAIAEAAGLSEWVIGVTIVAAGTSAPELATSLIGVVRGNHGISIGNLIGSDLFNLLGVLGVASLLNPLIIDSSAQGSLFLLVGLVIFVVILMRSGWKLSRWEGGLLVLINLVRWMMDLLPTV
ncbi:MAG: calcium/sodium antiporter [Ardenticatenaceae bacterium]|nr:calcium/sodium antiporter [Ardenticatenaceae bacterium]